MLKVFDAAEQDFLENATDDDVLGEEYEVICEDLSSQSCEVCRTKFKNDASFLLAFFQFASLLPHHTSLPFVGN